MGKINNFNLIKEKGNLLIAFLKSHGFNPPHRPLPGGDNVFPWR
jgi:hypothetical protein